LNFKVFKGILIPRPDTEVVCERVIQILKNDKNLIKGVDLCCGSGNISIALCKNLSYIEMDAIDIQKKACDNTKVNAKLNDVKLNVFKGDFYKTLIDKNKRYDFVISNPPYVDLKDVDKSMLKYENKINFNNSKDNLFFYKKIIGNYKNIIINPNHFLLAFEIGYKQKQELQKFIKTTPL
jgi:release factor glutamine methyltransferase